MTNPYPQLAQRVLHVAREEIGTQEGRSGGRWNNDQDYSDQTPGLEWSDFQPWCATFVSWVAMRAGAATLFPRTASCDVGGQWFKDRGRWSTYPAVGAQVFYGTPSDLSHTGIVEDFDEDFITTIEGNTNVAGGREGDGVYRKRRARRDPYVVGYGVPRFPEGVVSADPRFADEHPDKVRPPAPKPTAAERSEKAAREALAAARAGRKASKGKPRRKTWRGVIAALGSLVKGKKK